MAGCTEGTGSGGASRGCDIEFPFVAQVMQHTAGLADGSARCASGAIQTGMAGAGGPHGMAIPPGSTSTSRLQRLLWSPSGPAVAGAVRRAVNSWTDGQLMID